MDGRDQSDRGDGDRFRGDAPAARVREDLGSAHDRGVVVQGLALTLKRRTDDDARRFIAHGDELGDDLPRLEVSRQPEAPVAQKSHAMPHPA